MELCGGYVSTELEDAFDVVIGCIFGRVDEKERAARNPALRYPSSASNREISP